MTRKGDGAHRTRRGMKEDRKREEERQREQGKSKKVRAQRDKVEEIK